MCELCYERSGSPIIINAKIREASALIARVYKENPGGGHLHIVIDDENTEDGYVEWCLKELECTPLERECGAALIAMTEEERVSAIALYHGRIIDHGIDEDSRQESLSQH